MERSRRVNVKYMNGSPLQTFSGAELELGISIAMPIQTRARTLPNLLIR